MKAVSITQIVKKAKAYEVYLGNGTFHSFTSKRDANAFLSVTNKFINERLFAINLLLSEVYPYCRDLWFVSNDPQFDRTTNNYLDHIQFFVDNLPKRSKLSSGNYYAFIDLRKACETLKKLIKHLQSFKTIQTTQTLQRHKLAQLFERVHSEQRKITGYAQAEAYGFVNISNIEDQIDFNYALRAS